MTRVLAIFEDALPDHRLLELAHVQRFSAFRAAEEQAFRRALALLAGR